MKHILIIGAGRSSSCLISYLLEYASTYDWRVYVADQSIELAQSKIKNHNRGEALALNSTDLNEREKYIAKADVIISLMPPHLHMAIAHSCLKLKKNLLTASYLSPEMKALDQEVKENNLLFLNELGLDPGIDHLSAMDVIYRIKEKEGTIISFKSFCGGLIAPESDTNPWNFKFTWNPLNIILAGKGTAKYLENGSVKYIPYHHLFNRTEECHIENIGLLEGYANRDSLTYIEPYGINTIQTIMRGTFRKKGFCQSWNTFIQLGMTDDSYLIEKANQLTYHDFTKSFLPDLKNKSIEESFATYCNIALHSKEFEKIKWLGLFDKKPLPITTSAATPASILLCILEQKWKLNSGDKDMVVMQHQFEYQIKNKTHHLTSSMTLIGENDIETAMAKTVGLPLGIATKLLLQKKLSLTGVCLPIYPELYKPILAELSDMGITFTEHYL